jgi:hypothetical protein
MMTLEACMIAAAAKLDELTAASVVNAVATLRARSDPTAEEIKSFVQWYSAMLAEDRASNLAKLRAWLERDGALLN